jgi:hypothetical protein
VPGYQAPVEETGPAAAEAIITLVTLLGSIGTGTRARTEPPVRPSPRWAGILREIGASESTYREAVVLWSRFHGLLALELRGALPQMLDDPGALFDAELERVLSDLVR